jgi:hypothetical protein
MIFSHNFLQVCHLSERSFPYEFDFRAHDSAFKDRYLQLQNVRVRFIPTKKNDIRDLGPMENVIMMRFSLFVMEVNLYLHLTNL